MIGSLGCFSADCHHILSSAITRRRLFRYTATALSSLALTSRLMGPSMQVTQQPSQPEDTGQGQGSKTESGEASQAEASEQSPWKPASEDEKGAAADAAADCLNTEFGEVRLVHSQEPADSQPTESGERLSLEAMTVEALAC